MKALLGLLVALALSLSASAAPDRGQAVAEGQGWLSLLDSGHYDESWTEASALFRSKVERTKWTTQIKLVREPFGALASRQLLRADLSKSLPGVPDGDYAILSFQADFAQKHQAVETLTLMLDGDHWRAAGYFIK